MSSELELVSRSGQARRRDISAVVRDHNYFSIGHGGHQDRQTRGKHRSSQSWLVIGLIKQIPSILNVKLLPP